MAKSLSEITIDPHAIAAAIDASDALGLAGSTAMSAMLDKARTCRVSVSSALSSGGGEAKDVGPAFFHEIAARPDGSPCLNALASSGIYVEALSRVGPGEKLASVQVHWGQQYIGFFTATFEAIYPPRASAVRRKIISLLDRAGA
jgi:hypothetical protein